MSLDDERRLSTGLSRQQVYVVDWRRMRCHQTFSTNLDRRILRTKRDQRKRLRRLTRFSRAFKHSAFRTLVGRLEKAGMAIEVLHKTYSTNSISNMMTIQAATLFSSITVKKMNARLTLQ